MSDSIVRKATRTDLADILTFLKQEYEEESTGKGFWNQRHSIEMAQQHNELEVVVQPRDGKVLAFCVWSLHSVSMEIIEVRPGYRGKGFGPRLTQYVLDRLREQDSVGVMIQCMPEESLRVWQKMGFQRIENEGCTGIHAAYLFHTTREFPQDADRKMIGIQLFSGDKTPERHSCCQGIVEGPKCVLQRDFVACLSVPARFCSSMLNICVDRRLVYSDLLKYSTGVGVELRGNFVRCRELDMSKPESTES
jgi:GNAT superfamily N-acetyltransferase